MSRLILLIFYCNQLAGDYLLFLDLPSIILDA
jgi:hypothetical protein